MGCPAFLVAVEKRMLAILKLLPERDYLLDCDSEIVGDSDRSLVCLGSLSCCETSKDFQVQIATDSQR